MVPLYFALSLGYGSIKWWNILTPANHGAINRTVSRIALPLFAFKFTLNTDPYKWNYRVIAGDIIAKVLILGSLAAWTKYSSNGRYAWAITSYSLTSLTNALVMEVPLLNAMYGNWAGDLVVQLAIFQAVAWLTLLLFVLELKKALEEMIEDSFSILSLMKVVGRKLARNPNSYASLIGITWALVVNRYDFKLPKILDGCVYDLARTGTGMAMFSMRIFMATQESILACGTNLTLFGMALRFIAGPLVMAIGCFVVGLRGDVLRVAIIQAAVPQSITSFVYAHEYGLHPQVISTAVIFGMLVSLPLLVLYYVILELVVI